MIFSVSDWESGYQKRYIARGEVAAADCSETEKPVAKIASFFCQTLDY